MKFKIFESTKQTNNIEKEDKIEKSQNKENEDSFEERYKKEILPLLEALCPDNEPLEEYEKEVRLDLEESVKKVQVAQGKLIEYDENKTFQEMKEMLISRVKTVLDEEEHFRYKKGYKMPDPDLVSRSRITLLLSGDFSDLEKHYENNSSYKDKDKNKFFIDKLDYSALAFYLGIHHGSEKKKFTEKELDELVRAGLGRQLAKIPDYHFSSNLENVPESLFLEMIKVQEGFWLGNILENYSSKNKYSDKVFKELVSNGYGYIVLKNFDKFNNLDFSDVVDVYGPSYPYHVREIIEKLRKLKIKGKDLSDKIDYTVKHQRVTDHDQDIPEIKEGYKDLLGRAKVFRDRYDEKQQKWVSDITDEGRKVAKEFVQEGYVSFLFMNHDSNEYLKDLIDKDYSWFLNEIKKNDQEHLFMCYPFHLIKKEDQVDYAKKLIDKGKETFIVAMSKKDNHEGSLFQKRIFDQEIFDALLKKGLKIDPVFFHDLNEEALNFYLKNNPNLLSGKNILKNVSVFDFPDKDEYKTFREYREIIKDSTVFDNLGDEQINFIMNRLVDYDPEERKAYLEIFSSINKTPSQEIKRVRNEILDTIVRSDNPFETYRKIEEIFVKNNLPMVGKVTKIFDLLHSDQKIEKDLGNNGSRVLIGAKPEERREIMHKDLIKIHIESGNLSLKKYINIIKSGQEIIDKAESKGWVSLNFEELEKVSFVLKKFQTFYENSVLAQSGGLLNEEIPIDKAYKELRNNLETKENQKLSERLTELFINPAGYNSFEGALDAMKIAKNKATERNKKFVNEILNLSKVPVKADDLLKAVHSQYIQNILQNGSVSKEFLGGASGKDATPFDTDVSLVLEEDLGEGFKSAVSKSMANDSSLGDIILGFRNRDQFENTTNLEKKIEYDKNKFELFKTGGNRHYGIRTGISSSEIDFIVVKENQQAEKLKFDVAKNGFYIPILNKEGEVLFTPDEYKKLRSVFAGVSEYDGEVINLKHLDKGSSLFKDFQETLKKHKKDAEIVKNIGSTLKSQIIKSLQEAGLNFRHQFENSILGTEFHDTGSTSRLTNLPKDYDFDFGLRLDATQSKDAQKYAQILKEKIIGEKVIVESHEDGYLQLRANGVTEINGVKLGKPIDLDVGFGKKTDEVVYGSHDAVTDKLNSIEITNGKEIKEEVIANIILAKKILSEAKCYKKLDGGFGGIGVENWILQNGGNIIEAFKSFREASRNEKGERCSFDEMKEKYKIYDAGVNIKFNRHDNFMFVLKEPEYNKMLDSIERHLS